MQSGRKRYQPINAVLETVKVRRKRRLHKPEFKAKVALEAIKGEMTMAQMIKKFEVQQAQISQWKKQLLMNAGTAFDKGEKGTEDTEKTVQELHARARTDSRAQRKEMVSSKEELSISCQCELLDTPRSSFYYIPEPVSDEELDLMKLIDQCYLELPYYGTRRIKDWLYDEHGLVVNRKRIQRLRRLLAIETLYPKRNLSLANQKHKVYPYLLRGLEI